MQGRIFLMAINRITFNYAQRTRNKSHVLSVSVRPGMADVDRPVELLEERQKMFTAGQTQRVGRTGGLQGYISKSPIIPGC